MVGGQAKFTPKLERAKAAIKRAADRGEDFDTVIIAASGGTDSIVAADLVARYGPEYGIEPDAVVHVNTGAGIPQSRLVCKIFASMHDLAYIEAGPRRPEDSLAVRILNNGWPGGYGGSPATGGHGLEWANRKDKPMLGVYAGFSGTQLWVSGTRVSESKNRSINMSSTPVEKDDYSPRRVWLSPIYSWGTREKVEYAKQHGLPVSEAYLALGFSGECTACAFDETGLLTNIDLLCPELAHAIRTLAVWLGMRAVRGEVDIDPKQLCWGWDPDEEDAADDKQQTIGGSEPTAQVRVGCDEDSCSTREMPEWVRDLPPEQLVTREDVLEWWGGNQADVVARFAGRV